jgi:hypothetical protein
MSSVENLIQKLTVKGIQVHEPRTAFVNFLKYTCHPQHQISLALIHRFLSYSFCFHYWQMNSATLCTSILRDFEFLSKEGTVQIDMEQLRSFLRTQWVFLQNNEDIEGLLGRLTSRFGDAKNMTVIPNTDSTLLLTVDEHQQLRVRGYAPLARIQNGELFVPPAMTDLKYNSSLELDESHWHSIRLNRSKLGFFHIENAQLKGNVVNGHLFHRQRLIHGDLQQNEDLMVALKGLEKIYISKDSDSFYTELTQRLHRATQQFHPHPHAIEVARKVLLQGRTALEKIYPEDRLLIVLVSNLEYRIRNPYEPQNRSENQRCLDRENQIHPNRPAELPLDQSLPKIEAQNDRLDKIEILPKFESIDI